jgi:hypothetical protein
VKPRLARSVPLCTLGLALAACQSTPTPRGHAHNDYLHPRPLHDALDAGFQSVEADVFLVGGELLVGHTRRELRPERTLERLYLAPLRAHAAAGGAPITLLVDIKSDGAAVYAHLRERLAADRALLTSGAVTVILSGDRPWSLVAADPSRLVALDGRVRDLATNPPRDLVPWISDAWSVHFRWRGEGSMPEAERARLREIVATTHAQGRTLRFFGAPDRPEVWEVLVAEGVDWVGTDRLADFAAWRDGARTPVTARPDRN